MQLIFSIQFCYFLVWWHNKLFHEWLIHELIILLFNVFIYEHFTIMRETNYLKYEQNI